MLMKTGMSFSAGQVISHYEVLARIGEGGMGAVYKARDTELGRTVAMKVLHPNVAANPERRARFLREARAASSLNHPNIITIYDLLKHEGTDIIVMELVDGHALDELIQRKPLPLMQTLKIGVQVADALAKAHAAGIIHRDLKPANILVSKDGNAKVVDFGIAKLTEKLTPEDEVATVSEVNPQTDSGTVLGTAAYMSPEQAQGEHLDARSDIFSFGCVLYEMGTGHAAFHGESLASIIAAVLRDEPKPLTDVAPAQPHELGRIITKCMRKDPARRFQGMADIGVALEDLREDAVSGHLTGPIAVEGRSRRRPWVLPVVVLAVLALAVGVAFMLLQRAKQTPSEHPQMTRISPDDGDSYKFPAISPDGKFVAYLSDRNGNRGKEQIWLQQIGSGAPIQLTFAPFAVNAPAMTPGGTDLVYLRRSEPGMNPRGVLEVIPLLGGQPRKLADTGCVSGRPAVSPDGTTVAYFDCERLPSDFVLKIVPFQGGTPREITAYTLRKPRLNLGSTVWHPGGRYVLAWANTSEPTKDRSEDYLFFPLDGSEPRHSRISKVFADAGFSLAFPTVIVGDRVIVAGYRNNKWHPYDVKISADSFQTISPPRQLIFGTGSEGLHSISSNGIAAINSDDLRSDLYLIPMDASRGVVRGPTRRLSADSRVKEGPMVFPRSASLLFATFAGTNIQVILRDIERGEETIFIEVDVPKFGPNSLLIASLMDASQFFQSYPEGDQWSIRTWAAVSPSSTRVVCRQCGPIIPMWVPPGSRYLFIDPGRRPNDDPKRKKSVHLLDVESGKSMPWLSHESASVEIQGLFGEKDDWAKIKLQEPGSKTARYYLVPWSVNPPPPAQWIELKDPKVTAPPFASVNNFFFYWEGDALMSVRFDPATRRVATNPIEVKPWPGAQPVKQPNANWSIGASGIVFNHDESRNSVWTMKLPE
jgi:predicted Ser/Thr protein kinase